MTDSRRPITTRSAKWAQSFAKFLDRSGLTPNSISIASIAVAALAGLCAWWGFWWAAAVGIQVRLLCNLFDGMVAVEGGKATPAGGVYNELPDRLADTFILVGVGYGCGWPQLGLWCALGAALTAYIRVLGASLGTPHFFFGPMAKQHRMAVVTVALLAAQWWRGFLTLSLALVLLGTLVTCWRRSAAVCQNLNSEPSEPA